MKVKHFLETYENRLKCQLEGLINPPKEIKEFTKECVGKLKTLNLEDELRLESNTQSTDWFLVKTGEKILSRKKSQSNS